MIIKGADGLTPELIRNEVDRGGRLVIYAYCVSIVVMTFKRPTAIYFVPAGQSTVVRGLPFALVTLLFGWWGIPWGPIFSIECLYKTLKGGIDVTDDVIASLAPTRTAAQPGGAADTLPAFPARSPKKPFSRRQIFIGVTAVLVVISGIYASVCESAGKNLKVAVLNGLPTRVSYTINNNPVSVAPGGYQLLTLAESEFTIGATADRSAQTFHIETPFWSRPFHAQTLVINPDRGAIFCRYHVIYKGDNAKGDDHGQPTETVVYANQNHYLIDTPDYVFDEAPKSITMSATGFTSRSRVALVPVSEPSDRLSIITQNLGPEAAATYAHTLALNHPDDELALNTALQILTTEAALALLESHVDDRPVHIEWHRAYQNYAERLNPAVDLRPRYSALAAASPDEGGFRYLLGRIEPIPADARVHYELALAAERPCAYAHLGLAYIDAANNRFAEALAHYDLAIRAGIKNLTVRSARSDMLLALRRYDDLLADIRQRRAASPLNVAIAAEEIQCVLVSSRDANLAQKIADSALKSASAKASPDDIKNVRAYLDSTLAYALGDEAGFARALDQLPGPVNAFKASICRRDHAAARLALKQAPLIPSDYLFTLHLVARQSGDEPAAQTYWQEAVAALNREGGSRQRVAEQLANHAPLDPQWMRTASLTAVQKSLIFTCLGLSHPEQRQTYYDWAAESNFSPAFPHLLINSILRAPPRTAAF